MFGYFFYDVGLHINLHNSCLIGPGMDSVEVQHLALLLGCQIRSLPIRYLGLQLGEEKGYSKLKLSFGFS